MKYIITLFIVSLFFVSADIYAQDWAWMKGSSSTNQPGVYGSLGIPDTANTPGARTGSLSWKDNSGNFWLFGGDGFDALSNQDALNDLWKYDKSSNSWTWMKGGNSVQQVSIYGTQGVSEAANTPGGRSNSCTWIDNLGNFWLFGGTGYDYSTSNGAAGNYLNNLWKYDPATNNWAWMKGDTVGFQAAVYGSLGVEAPANNPGSRTQSVSWKDGSGNLWMFGGYGLDNSLNQDALNDLWKFNIAANNWTWVNGGNTVQQVSVYGTKGVPNINNTPGGRSGASAWTDNSGNFWLFGGTGYDYSTSNGSSNNYLNDLWMYNPSTNFWTWVEGDTVGFQAGQYGALGVPDSTNNPGGRMGAASWVDNSGNLWLLGGFGIDASAAPTEMSDLWEYNISSGNWTWVKGDDSYSSSSYGIYGSQGVSAPGNNPGGREFSSYWIDNTTNNLWLFGGRGYDDHAAFGDPLNDLWTVSGGSLPVELQSFTVSVINDGVKLFWVTSTEVNNYGFEVERSQKSGVRSQNENWEKIGFIKGNGNSNSIKEYSFTNNNISEGNYSYRLKQVDNDGSFEYSKIVETSFMKPMNFALEQNYPNPFNPSTNIKFHIASTGLVTLKIYDVLGKEVSTLVNEVKEPGTYDVNFNAESLSSGVYIYELKTGNFVSSKTMMILK